MAHCLWRSFTPRWRYCRRVTDSPTALCRLAFEEWRDDSILWRVGGDPGNGRCRYLACKRRCGTPRIGGRRHKERNRSPSQLFRSPTCVFKARYARSATPRAGVDAPSKHSPHAHRHCLSPRWVICHAKSHTSLAWAAPLVAIVASSVATPRRLLATLRRPRATPSVPFAETMGPCGASLLRRARGPGFAERPLPRRAEHCIAHGR
jgi:hypothetical protein